MPVHGRLVALDVCCILQPRSTATVRPLRSLMANTSMVSVDVKMTQGELRYGSLTARVCPRSMAEQTAGDGS